MHYHQDKEYLTTSLIRHLLNNPLKFYLIWQGILQLPPSSQMKIGQAFHKLTLQPDDFYKEFAILPEFNMRKKEDREEKEKFISANEGKIILTQSEFEVAKKLTYKSYEAILQIENFQASLKAILHHPRVIIEQPFFAIIDDVKIKCRPDILINLSRNPNKPYYIVIDLKSVEEANPDSFIKNAARYMYHLQVAVYKKVLEENNIDVKRFLFLAVAKDDYSKAEWYEISEKDEYFGYELLDRAIKKFKYCKKHNEWREGIFNYAEEKFEPITEIELPQWIYYQNY